MPHIITHSAGDLLACIPRRLHRGVGFKPRPVKLVDFSSTLDYITVATDSAAMFVYDRGRRNLRCCLTCPGIKPIISAIFAMELPERYCIAVGTENGDVYVFILTTDDKDSVDILSSPGHHKTEVTCLQFDSHARHIYSGDSFGNVFSSKIDQGGLSISVLLHKETCGIVDLLHYTLTLKSGVVQDADVMSIATKDVASDIIVSPSCKPTPDVGGGSAGVDGVHTKGCPGESRSPIANDYKATICARKQDRGDCEESLSVGDVTGDAVVEATHDNEIQGNRINGPSLGVLDQNASHGNDCVTFVNHIVKENPRDGIPESSANLVACGDDNWRNRRLLVTSKQRSFLIGRFDDEGEDTAISEYSVRQIGSKPHKSGLYGAAVCDDHVFCSRPSGRLWKCHLATGQVLQTLMFKEAFKQFSGCSANLDFGPLIAMTSNHLATYSVEQGIVVVDYTLGHIVAHRDDIRPIKLIYAPPLREETTATVSVDGDGDILALICDRSTVVNVLLSNNDDQNSTTELHNETPPLSDKSSPPPPPSLTPKLTPPTNCAETTPTPAATQHTSLLSVWSDVKNVFKRDASPRKVVDFAANDETVVPPTSRGNLCDEEEEDLILRSKRIVEEYENMATAADGTSTLASMVPTLSHQRIPANEHIPTCIKPLPASPPIAVEDSPPRDAGLNDPSKLSSSSVTPPLPTLTAVPTPSPLHPLPPPATPSIRLNYSVQDIIPGDIVYSSCRKKVKKLKKHKRILKDSSSDSKSLSSLESVSNCSLSANQSDAYMSCDETPTLTTSDLRNPMRTTPEHHKTSPLARESGTNTALSSSPLTQHATRTEKSSDTESCSSGPCGRGRVDTQEKGDKHQAKLADDIESDKSGEVNDYPTSGFDSRVSTTPNGMDVDCSSTSIAASTAQCHTSSTSTATSSSSSSSSYSTASVSPSSIATISASTAHCFTSAPLSTTSSSCSSSYTTANVSPSSITTITAEHGVNEIVRDEDLASISLSHNDAGALNLGVTSTPPPAESVNVDVTCIQREEGYYSQTLAIEEVTLDEPETSASLNRMIVDEVREASKAEQAPIPAQHMASSMMRRTPEDESSGSGNDDKEDESSASGSNDDEYNASSLEISRESGEGAASQLVDVDISGNNVTMANTLINYVGKTNSGGTAIDSATVSARKTNGGSINDAGVCQGRTSSSTDDSAGHESRLISSLSGDSSNCTGEDFYSQYADTSINRNYASLGRGAHVEKRRSKFCKCGRAPGGGVVGGGYGEGTGGISVEGGGGRLVEVGGTASGLDSMGAPEKCVCNCVTSECSCTETDSSFQVSEPSCEGMDQPRGASDCVDGGVMSSCVTGQTLSQQRCRCHDEFCNLSISSNRENVTLKGSRNQGHHHWMDADCWTSYKLPKSTATKSAGGCRGRKSRKSTKLLSLCSTERFLFCVDDAKTCFKCNVGESKLNWQSINMQGNIIQLSVSGDEAIIWALHDDHTVWAWLNKRLCKDFNKRWMRVALNVRCISVDNHSAWFVLRDNSIVMQKELDSARPLYKAIRISHPSIINGDLVDVRNRLNHVVFMNSLGVLYLATVAKLNTKEDKHDDNNPQSNISWRQLTDLNTQYGPMMVSSFDFGFNDSFWCLDCLQSLWFTDCLDDDEITWYKLSLGYDYLVESSKISGNSKSTASISSLDGHQLIAARHGGIFIYKTNQEADKTLIANRSNVIGHNWLTYVPSMLSGQRWSDLTVQSLDDNKASVWLQNDTGDLFTFNPCAIDPAGALVAVEASFPGPSRLTSCRSNLWTLCRSQGIIEIRDNRAWIRQNLEQLGRTRLIDVCIGGDFVVAADQQGDTYLRLGTGDSGERHLVPAWVPMDGQAKHARTFTRVFIGASDSMIWALDDMNGVYVRKGVSMSLPIGTHWLHIKGSEGIDMALSSCNVYLLTPGGEVLQRHGVQCPKMAEGNYWKVIPGKFTKIAVTHDDELWALDSNFRLCNRHVKSIETKPSYISEMDSDQSCDFEII